MGKNPYNFIPSNYLLPLRKLLDHPIFVENKILTPRSLLFLLIQFCLNTVEERKPTNKILQVLQIRLFYRRCTTFLRHVYSMNIRLFVKLFILVTFVADNYAKSIESIFHEGIRPLAFDPCSLNKCPTFRLHSPFCSKIVQPFRLVRFFVQKMSNLQPSFASWINSFVKPSNVFALLLKKCQPFASFRFPFCSLSKTKAFRPHVQNR